jgi:hypothetical protein
MKPSPYPRSFFRPLGRLALACSLAWLAACTTDIDPGPVPGGGTGNTYSPASTVKFLVSGDGITQTYSLSENRIGNEAYYTAGSFRTIITLQEPNSGSTPGSDINFSLQFSGQSPGNFSWNGSNGLNNLGLRVPGESAQRVYLPGSGTGSGGTTVVNSYTASKGGRIKGTFSGRLYRSSGTGPDLSKPLNISNGEFDVYFRGN